MNWLQKKILISLRWTEKYTKTDMLYLAKGGFWLWLGQIVASLASLASSIAFAHLLTPEAYGQYRYVLSLLNIIAIPTLLGIDSALMKSVAQGMDKSLIIALKTRLTWGLFGTVAGLCVATYYLLQGNQSLATNFLAVSLFVPFFYSFSLYASFLRGKKLFQHSALYSSALVIISTMFLIAGLFLTKNISILLICYFLPYTILMGAFVYVIAKKYISTEKTDPEIITYGKHLSFIGILGTIAGETDKLLLWYFIGPAQVAIYSFAEAPVNQMKMFISKFDLIIFPKIAENDIDHLKNVVFSKMWKVFLVILFLVIIYIILAPAFFSLLFPQYLASVKYSQILALTLLFTPITFMTTTFTAHAKIRENYYLKFVSSVGTIGLLILLTPIYGIWGAIASYLIMRGVVFITTLLLFKRLT